MKAYDWIKRRLKDGLPLWLIVIVLCTSLILYVLAKSLGVKIDSDFLTLSWILAVLGSIGSIVATSIIAGGVLKILATQQYFTDAITAVIYGESGLDGMVSEHRLRVWKSLTRRIYVPNINKSIDVHEIESLYNAVAEAAGRQISYNESFFIRHLERDLEFEFDANDSSKIVMKDFFRTTIIPFDSTKEVCWSSTRRVEKGQDVRRVISDVVRLEIEKEVFSKRKTVYLEDNTIETTTYIMENGNKYDLVRERSQSWSINDDPQVLITTPYIIWGGNFRIVNNFSSHNIIFNEIGGRDIFKVLSGESDKISPKSTIRRSIKEVMLPKRGFLLTVVPIHTGS